MATGLGIDIGSESIKIVQARISGGKVTVTGAIKIPRNEAPLTDAPQEEHDGSVLPNLGSELKKAHLRRSGTLGISGREVILKYLATPPMPPDKMRMVIEMEIGGKLTARGPAADTPEITYDFRLLNVPSGLKGDLVIMAGIVKNEYLFGMDSALKSAGVTSNHITPSCFGLVNAYLRTQTIPEKETVILVDIGHELLEVAILEENRLYFARSAPGGGKKFTTALDKVLKLGPAKTAEFKHARARLYPEGAKIPSNQETTFQAALKEGAEAITGAIRSSIMFCRTQAKMPKLDYNRVIISGGGARLNGLREYLEKKINRPVQVLDLSAGLDLRKMDAASAKCFEGDVTDMAVALGLAIVDADPTSFHFSLVPAKIAKKRNFWRKTVFGIAAGVVLIAGLFPAIQNSREAAAAATERVQHFEELQGDARKQKEDFETRLKNNQALGQKVNYYARQTRMGRIYLDFFTAIRAQTPKDISLTYLGPVEAAGRMGQVMGFTTSDSAIREFTILGYYDQGDYPETKFNETWEKMREKLLQVPGIARAEKELTEDDDKEHAKTLKPGTRTFRLNVGLQDDGKLVAPAKSAAAPAAPAPAAPAAAPAPAAPAKPPAQ